MSAAVKEYFNTYKNFSQEERTYAISLLHKLYGYGLVSQEEMDIYSSLLTSAEKIAA